MIRNQDKPKQFRPLFLRHALTMILDIKLKTTNSRFYGGLFELEMLQIFTKAF